MKPKISVIMAINKFDNYVSSAVESILNQSLKEFEYIIVINGDEEKLIKYFGQLQSKDSRIKIFITQIHQLQFNLNYALNLAQADIIARMDSDDIADLNRLEIQYKYLKENDIDFLGSDFYFINEKGEILEKNTIKVRKNEQIRKALQYKCVFCHPTIMFKKEVVLQVGGYCFGKISEDWDLFLRLSRNKNIKFEILDKKLLKYRIHTMQMSKQKIGISMFTISFLYFRELLFQKKISYIKGGILYLILSTPIYNILKFFKNKSK